MNNLPIPPTGHLHVPRHRPYIPRLVPNNLWVLWWHSRVFIVTLEIFIEAVNFCESHVTVSGKIMNTVKHAAKNLRGIFVDDSSYNDTGPLHIVCTCSVPTGFLGILKISIKSVRYTNCQNGLLLKPTAKCTVDYATTSTSTICLRLITVCVSPLYLPSTFSLPSMLLVR